MLDTRHPELLDTLASTLDTMAFAAVMRAQDPSSTRPPRRPHRLSIHFTSPLRGHLELVAPEFLGVLLAANMLGTDPQDPEARDRAIDVLKEVLNVTCGRLLQQIAATLPGAMEMSLPESQTFDPDTDWAPLLADPATAILDIEGQLVAIRLVESP